MITSATTDEAKRRKRTRLLVNIGDPHDGFVATIVHYLGHDMPLIDDLLADVFGQPVRT